ncbi:ATP synthase F0 subunit A [Longimonas halophila]|uniref:ATP synthase subunit a n=1 Tax=Longimonas halophila TaxID=1469170 RepID=A0A2H3NIN5_9BACT|nr:F0F1 ATP synthase subunit A [Longimonas halophila]PEN05436.1 ATP synthase F0 subunit A [Longimonas halophila]
MVVLLAPLMVPAAQASKASAEAATARTAAAADDLTLDYVVNRAIIGHAADGYYLDFSPFGSIELPRILLVRNPQGNLGLDAASSTKSLLKSGNYGIYPEGKDDLVTPGAELDDLIAEKKHLYGTVAPAGQGEIVVDLSITRHFMFGLLAMGIVAVVFITLANRYKRGIGRSEAPRGVLQNMMEVIIVFLRDEVAKPNIGPKYKQFLPFLLSAFFFILVANILGLIPFSGSATGNIAVTGLLAFSTFIIGQVNATADYWKHLLLGPPDAPWPIRVILIPIEIMGAITRHVALAIRLFANMMGGALIIFSLIGVVFVMNVLFTTGAAAWGAGIISTGFTVFVLLLKLLVAFIQAYVFTILSALFIGMAVEEHDHAHDEGASATASAH